MAPGATHAALPRTGELAAAAVTDVYSPFAPALPLNADPAWHAARRLAPAPTAALVADINRIGVGTWIAQQIATTGVDNSACDALMTRHFPWLTLTPAELITASGNRPWIGAAHVSRATAARQIFTRRVLFESMVEFWGDLLYVPFTSDKCFGFVIDYDREVIRAHAMASFRSMLRAALRHPALLLFVDNETNVATGVNENLGRELLELHTVGRDNLVDGSLNYTEDDVRNSSLILTGFTRDWPVQRARFYAARHHVGPVKVMGFEHSNAVAKGGPKVLDLYADYLARHPSTARRIATRLCVRFVSDTPPTSLVDRLTATYLSSDTDVKQVLTALFASSEFRDSVGQKIRRPAEYTNTAIAAGRPRLNITADTTTYPRAALTQYMDRLVQSGHRPRDWPVVNGYPDTAGPWTSTQSMLARLRSAYSVAAQDDPELPPTQTWAATTGLKGGQKAHEAASRLFITLTGFDPTATHRGALAAVLVGAVADPGPAASMTKAQMNANLTEAVAQVFASPYFALR